MDVGIGIHLPRAVTLGPVPGTNNVAQVLFSLFCSFLSFNMYIFETKPISYNDSAAWEDREREASTVVVSWDLSLRRVALVTFSGRNIFFVS